MTTLAKGCTLECQHVDPQARWRHEVKLDEDAGKIHTDDCGFMRCTHDHEPSECCTAGQPGSNCRVGLCNATRTTAAGLSRCDEHADAPHGMHHDRRGGHYWRSYWPSAPAVDAAQRSAPPPAATSDLLTSDLLILRSDLAWLAGWLEGTGCRADALPVVRLDSAFTALRRIEAIDRRAKATAKETA